MNLIAYRPRKPIRSSAAHRTVSPIGRTLCANSHPHCSCGSMSGGDLPAGASEEQSCRVFESGNRMIFARPPHYGAIFTDHAARDQFLLERGYLVLYSRNSVSFVSSRAYRKHTGRLSALPDSQWLRHYHRLPPAAC